MLSRLLRKWSSDLWRPFLGVLLRAGITANQLTFAGLIAAMIAGVLIALDAMLAAGIVLLISGTLDALDGALARLGGSDSPYGAFVDSIADHYGDVSVYLGFAWAMLAAGDSLMVMLTLVAMFGSVMGSHIRSRGGLLGIDTKDVGWFTRVERIVVMAAGLLTGFVPAAIVVLAIANNVSALQRLAYCLSFRASAARPGIQGRWSNDAGLRDDAGFPLPRE
jgi:CDP-diacylglycerol--glycerol-3-phosphate 3-phosphatidyltransferase